MDLNKFVEESLVQIAQGIESAQKKLEGTGAIVNPRDVEGTNSGAKKVYGYVRGDGSHRNMQVVQAVSFDVVVSAAEGSTAQGGGGLKVGVLSLGGKTGSEDRSGSESRICFTVPMVLPSS